MYVALKNRETSWLLRKRRQDIYLLHASTKTHAPPACKQLHPQADRAAAAQLQPPEPQECRKRTRDSACVLGENFFNDHGNTWNLTRLLLN